MIVISGKQSKDINKRKVSVVACTELFFACLMSLGSVRPIEHFWAFIV